MSPLGNVRSTEGQQKHMRPLRPGLRTGTLPLPPTCHWPKQVLWPSNTKSMETNSSPGMGVDAGRSEELGPKLNLPPSPKANSLMQSDFNKRTKEEMGDGGHCHNPSWISSLAENELMFLIMN